MSTLGRLPTLRRALSAACERPRRELQHHRALQQRDERRLRPFDLADLKRCGDRAPFDKLRANGLFKTVLT